MPPPNRPTAPSSSRAAAAGEASTPLAARVSDVSNDPVLVSPTPATSARPQADRLRALASASSASAEAAGLPARYDEDRIVLLIRDPHWCFCWWELTPFSRAQLDAPTTVGARLRFYDVTSVEWDGRNHRAKFDLEVGQDVGSWYVELGRPGARFVAELGLLGHDGRWACVARSNRVDMPRAQASESVDSAWPMITSTPERFEMSAEDLKPSSSMDVLGRAVETAEERSEPT